LLGHSLVRKSTSAGSAAADVLVSMSAALLVLRMQLDR
jgi:hypothetical protein